MYQKNIILIISIFLLFSCMDKTDLNNDADTPSIEKKSDNASPKGITFKKNADGKYEYVGRDLPFSIGKKDNDQSDLNTASNEPSKNKSKLAEIFTVKWPWEKTNTDLNDERSFFKVGDTVAIRGCTIDRAAFKFIRSLEAQVGNQGSPFAVPFNLESNLTGGLGAFIGYGAVYDTVVCVR